MPPKTRSSGPASEPTKDKRQNEKPAKDEDAMSIDSKEENEEDENPKKRKSPPTEPQEPEEKAPRQSQPQSKGKDGSEPTTKQILNFLLSAEAIPLCYPEDDISAAKSGDFPITYSMTPPSSFTPFEHLITAHLLSKPLSHVLGIRSIRTLLNPPFTLSTPEKISSEGENRVWEALEAARTQHRQKTATYIYKTAESYTDGETMFALAEEANDTGSAGVIAHIKDTVDGMGETGAQIFCRRIQCVDGWGEAVWPYADPRAIQALQELGVDVNDADELQGLVEEHVDWQRVGQMGLQKLTGTGRRSGSDSDSNNKKREEVVKEDDTAGGTGEMEDMDMDQRVQVEFVVLLERAVGAVLEGNTPKVVEQAAGWK